MEYKYIVRFAHVNEEAADVEGGIHHGPGEMEITTYEPVETQQQRNDIAAAVGRSLHEKHGITEIVIQAIIPIRDKHKVIDSADFPGTDE